MAKKKFVEYLLFQVLLETSSKLLLVLEFARVRRATYSAKVACNACCVFLFLTIVESGVILTLALVVLGGAGDKAL